MGFLAMATGATRPRVITGLGEFQPPVVLSRGPVRDVPSLIEDVDRIGFFATAAIVGARFDCVVERDDGQPVLREVLQRSKKVLGFPPLFLADPFRRRADTINDHYVIILVWQ